MRTLIRFNPLLAGEEHQTKGVRLQTSDKTLGDHFTPAPLLCPDCGSPMKFMAITPKLLDHDIGEIFYRCDRCDIDMRRLARTA
jgi:hypothetical protein